MHKAIRILLGAVLWSGLIAAAVWAIRSGATVAGDAGSVTEQFWQATAGQGRWLPFRNPQKLSLQVGDPVFQEAEPGRLVHVGHVYALVDDRGERHLQGSHAQGVVYLTPQARMGEGMHLEHYRADLSIAAGMQMLFPPEKRHQVQRLLARHWQQRKHELLDTLRPVVERTLR